MDLDHLLDYISLPQVVEVGKYLDETDFKLIVKKRYLNNTIFNNSSDNIIICDKSHILYDKRSPFILECISGKERSYYPPIYTLEDIYKYVNKRVGKVAEIDFEVIYENSGNIRLLEIFEHKRGGKINFYEEVVAQLIRYQLLNAYIIKNVPVVGYIYLGRDGHVYLIDVTMKEGESYYLILLNPDKKGESGIIELEEELVKKIIYSKRRNAEMIIKKEIIPKIEGDLYKIIKKTNYY